MVTWERLRICHVEPGGRDDSAPQSLGEGILVHQGPARDVDKHASRLHGGELLPAHHVVCVASGRCS